MKCYGCKKTFSKKLYCPDCSKGKRKKVLTKKHTKIHVGRLSKDLKQFSCDCIFGSWWRWAKYWKDNRPNSRCKHSKWSMKKIDKEKLYKPVDVPCEHCDNTINNLKVSSEKGIKLVCGTCSKTFRITNDRNYYLNHRDEKKKILVR